MAKILIVDDDPDIVDAGRMILEKEGHQVAAAGTRTEGMKLAEEFKPDLFILDVMMEEVDDGIAMAQDLRIKGVDQPILMLTSISKVTGLRFDKDADANPVDDFQEKPISPANLVAKVNALLAKKEA